MTMGSASATLGKKVGELNIAMDELLPGKDFIPARVARAEKTLALFKDCDVLGRGGAAIGNFAPGLLPTGEPPSGVFERLALQPLIGGRSAHSWPRFGPRSTPNRPTS